LNIQPQSKADSNPRLQYSKL